MKAINLEELVLLTHPGELRVIRDAKGSVYVPGWKTPKPAAVVARWKLETICRLIEQKRLYFYPTAEEHKLWARSLAAIQVPAGNPDIVIDGPEPHPEIVTAPEPRKSCSESCSPSDYWASGKCARVGCWRLDINPEQAEAIQTLNALRRVSEDRKNKPTNDASLLETLIIIIGLTAVAAAIVWGNFL